MMAFFYVLLLSKNYFKPQTKIADAVSVSSIITVTCSPIFNTALLAGPEDVLIVVCLVNLISSFSRLYE